jgi:hypothetical protein
MSSEWFAANNVERAYQVLSAINLLSINAKLKLLKSENPIETGELIQAKQILLEFTSGLSALLEKAEKREGRTILGTDPRMSQLASYFRDAMTRPPYTDDLPRVKLDDLPSLLNTEDESSLNTLVKYLDHLRSLVEQYSYSDMVVVFGEGWS